MIFGTAAAAAVAAAGTTPLQAGHNPATWMLEVTGGAMATLIPANTSVNWPDHYLGSQLALENAQQAEVLAQQVRGRGSGVLALLELQPTGARGLWHLISLQQASDRHAA